MLRFAAYDERRLKWDPVTQLPYEGLGFEHVVEAEPVVVEVSPGGNQDGKLHILPCYEKALHDAQAGHASHGRAPAPGRSAAEMFRTFDADGSGFIDTNELPALLRALGFTPSNTECARILKQYDSDRNGKLCLAEFERLHAEQRPNLPKRPVDEKALRQLFVALDTDKSDTLSLNELREGLVHGGAEPLPAREVDALLRAADVRGTGQLTFRDFVAVLTGQK